VVGEIARGLDTVTPAGASPLAPALQGVRPGWRVAILSDFLGDEAALLAQAARLIVEGIELYAIHLVADEEIVPRYGTRRAEDPEQPALHRVLHEDVTPAYIEAFSAWREDLASRWRLAGTEFAVVRTSDDTASAIRGIVRGV
jgi:hypothetical protein